ncbi:unnamed protein product [Protopolystoma xenopodis]|uniref:Uncharacterized protein n=1 Tax=Protopolystoma xenopodis TaxID=117903 RepID=A0A448XQU6_9PLAT|nr:unnamed protein product [Protopolystoma xenopodis]
MMPLLTLCTWTRLVGDGLDKFACISSMPRCKSCPRPNLVPVEVIPFDPKQVNATACTDCEVANDNWRFEHCWC